MSTLAKSPHPPWALHLESSAHNEERGPPPLLCLSIPSPHCLHELPPTHNCSPQHSGMWVAAQNFTEWPAPSQLGKQGPVICRET